MDPGTLASIVALAVAFMALVISLAQALLQYIVTGQLIRICDSVVYGKMPGQGRRVWDYPQFRFRVVYSIPQISLDSSLWAGSNSRKPHRMKSTPPSLSLAASPPAGKPLQTMERSFGFAGRGTRPPISGEASWVSFVRTIQHSSGDSLECEMIEGDADRCPADLPVVPMQLSLRDVVAGAIRAGMECTDVSFQQQTLSMQGDAGTITSSLHPVLGALLHFSPKRPYEQHGLRTENGTINPHWMMRMWDICVVAGVEYNLRARKHFEEDEEPWGNTLGDRSLVKHQGYSLYKPPERRNSIRQARLIDLHSTEDHIHTNVLPSEIEMEGEPMLNRILSGRQQDGEWSFTRSKSSSAKKPMIQNIMYLPVEDGAAVKSPSRLGWFHRLFSYRKHLRGIHRLSDTAVGKSVLPTVEYTNRNSLGNILELENGLGNMGILDNLITTVDSTTIPDRLCDISKNLKSDSVPAETAGYHDIDRQKAISSLTQQLNTTTRIPRPYLMSGRRINGSVTSSRSTVEAICNDQEEQLAKARTEQIVRKWIQFVQLRREEREKKSNEPQARRIIELSEVSFRNSHVGKQARRSRDSSHRSRSKSLKGSRSQPESSRAKLETSRAIRIHPQSRDRHRQRGDSIKLLQTQSQNRSRSPVLSQAGADLGADGMKLSTGETASSSSLYEPKSRHLNDWVRSTNTFMTSDYDDSIQELSGLEPNSLDYLGGSEHHNRRYFSPGRIYRSPSPLDRSRGRDRSRSYSPDPILNRNINPLYRNLSPLHRNRSPPPRSVNFRHPDQHKEPYMRRGRRRNSSVSLSENNEGDLRTAVEYGQGEVHTHEGQRFWSVSTDGIIDRRNPPGRAAKLGSPTQQILPSLLHERDGSTRKEIPPNAQWTRISSRLVSPEALKQSNENFRWEGFTESSGFIIVTRILSREEIETYADLTRKLRVTTAAAPSVNFDLHSDIEESDDTEAAYDSSASFERVRDSRKAIKVPRKKRNLVKRQDSSNPEKDNKTTNPNIVNLPTRRIAQDKSGQLLAEDEYSATESSDRDLSDHDDDKSRSSSVTSRNHQTSKTARFLDHSHSVSSEQTFSDEDHVLFILSNDVLKRTIQRMEQCIDIGIALSYFRESDRDETKPASSVNDVTEQVQNLNIMLTDIITKIRKNSNTKEMATFAVYELDMLIRSVERSLTALEWGFGLFEVDKATRKLRRSMWEKMLFEFKKSNTCSLMDHFRTNCSFASELLKNLKADRFSSTPSENLKEKVSTMNNWPFYSPLRKQSSSSIHTGKSSSRPYLPHDAIPPINRNDIVVIRNSENSDSDNASNYSQKRSSFTSEETSVDESIPYNPRRYERREYKPRGYRKRERSPIINESDSWDEGYETERQEDSPIINEADWDIRYTNQGRKRSQITGNVNWLWICQVDILPGYFATPWQRLFSEPVCTGAISVLLRGLEFYTNDSTKRNTHDLSRYHDWIQVGKRTYPSYAINAKGGVVVSGTYEMVRFDGFDNFISPIELLNGDGLQVHRSYAQDLQTLLDSTAELMSLDCWLSMCGRLPEIFNGPSNLLRTMPALVQCIMTDFKVEFENTDRTSSEGGFQIIQDIAESLKQALIDHKLSKPEQLFAIVALLRAAKTALCVIHGTDTAKLREVLLHDVQVYLA